MKHPVILIVFCLSLVRGPSGEPPAVERLLQKHQSQSDGDLRGAADKGDAGAQFVLAYRIETRPSWKPDHASMLRWYDAAAKQGLAPAQARLGYHLLLGCRVPRDLKTGREMLARALSADSAFAHFALGHFHLNGLLTLPNGGAAEHHFQKAAELGYARGTTGRAYLAYALGEKENYTKLLREAAKAGDSWAQFSISEILGYSKNRPEAKEWRRKALAQGCDRAHYFQARELEARQDADLDLVLDHYRRSARLQNADAQFRLATLLSEGVADWDHPDSSPTALFEAAARHGNYEACERIAVQYRNGYIVERDPLRACYYYCRKLEFHRIKDGTLTAIYRRPNWWMASYPVMVRFDRNTREAIIGSSFSRVLDQMGRAIYERDAEAMMKIGGFAEKGDGVNQDDLDALIWYLLAADHGHPQANVAVVRVSDGLTGRQRRLARREATAMTLIPAIPHLQFMTLRRLRFSLPGISSQRQLQ